MSRVETRQKQKEKALLSKKDVTPPKPEDIVTVTTPVDQSMDNLQAHQSLMQLRFKMRTEVLILL